MPPARDNVYPSQGAADSALNRPLTCHVINIQDLLTNEKGNDDQSYLTLKINKFSPEEISIKRSGGTLTVESKKEDKMREGGPVIEHRVRRYQIPAGGYTKEFGAQLATSGILSIERPGMGAAPDRIINLSCLPKTKPGTVVHMDPMAGWTKEGLKKYMSLVVNKGEVHCPQDKQTEKKTEQEGDGAEPNEKEVKENDNLAAGADAAEKIDTPGDNLGDIEGGVRCDEYA